MLLLPTIIFLILLEKNCAVFAKDNFLSTSDNIISAVSNDTCLATPDNTRTTVSKNNFISNSYNNCAEVDSL